MGKVIFIILIIILSGCNRKGCIDVNCENGYGTFLYSNGGTVKGHWSNGELNGYGVMVFGKGDYEGDIYRGNFINGFSNGKGSYYFSKIDATLIGKFEKFKIEGRCKVYFGKNSLWKGTFIGNWKNGYCKEWVDYLKFTKSGEEYIEKPGAFFDSIMRYNIYNDFHRFIIPLKRIYKKNLAKENISYEEMAVLFDSLHMMQKKVNYSLARIKSFREFDKNIPLKKATYDYFYTFKCCLYNEIPNLYMIIQREPSKLKPEIIHEHMQPLVDRIKVKTELWTKTQDDFLEKYKLN